MLECGGVADLAGNYPLRLAWLQDPAEPEAHTAVEDWQSLRADDFADGEDVEIWTIEFFVTIIRPADVCQAAVVVPQLDVELLIIPQQVVDYKADIPRNLVEEVTFAICWCRNGGRRCTCHVC